MDAKVAAVVHQHVTEAHAGQVTRITLIVCAKHQRVTMKALGEFKE